MNAVSQPVSTLRRVTTVPELFFVWLRRLRGANHKSSPRRRTAQHRLGLRRPRRRKALVT